MTTRPKPTRSKATRSKRTRLRRWLIGLAAAAGALAVLVGGAAWFLLGTEPGARWLFARVGAMIAGSLEVAELDGPIRGPLAVRGLVYESDGFEVRVDRLALDWRLRELVHRRLDVVDLEAEGVRVLLADREERDEPQALPDVHLPVNIIVRGARVRDLVVVQPPPAAGPGQPGKPAEPAAPLRIDSIELVTRTIGDVVEIERLVVRSPDLAAEVSGRVEPNGAYPVDLALDWSATLPDTPRLAGRGTFTGTLERLRVEHALSAPVAARLVGTLTTPLRELGFDATVEAEPFPLRLLGDELPEATVGGRVHAVGGVEAFRGEADLAADTADFGPLAADLAVARDGERWRIDRLALRSPAAPTRIEAGGELTLPAGGEPRFDLDASWRDLVWPLWPQGGEPSFTSPAGRASIAGTAADYRLEAAGRVVAAGLPPTPVELAGRGGRERLAVERFRAGLLGGVVTAEGEVGWSPRVTWRLAVAGRGLDPEAVWPDGAGELALTARTAGRLDDAGPMGRVAPLRVTGTLRGEPLAAQGAVRLAGERIELPEARVEWGSLRLAARGRVAPDLDLGFDLEAPNLAVALPDTAGALTASGRLTGPTATPRIEATAEGEGLAWGETSVQTLTATADLDLAPGGRLAVDAEAAGVASGERSFGRVALELAGTRERHRLSASVDAAEGGLRLAASGGLDAANAWSGELGTLDLAIPEAGSWSLAAPAAVTASAEAVEVGRLCEVSGGARLCAEGGWRGAGGWRAAAELTELPLALAATLLPPDLAIDGTVGGTVRAAADAAGAVTVAADLAPGPGAVDYPLPDGGTETLRFGRGALRAAVDPAGARAALRLPLPDLGRVEGELTLPGWRAAGAPAGDQPIAGTLQAEITDLSFVQAFSEQLDDTAGRLTADLRIAGTVGRPRIGGAARLAEGRAAVPELGIRLTAIELAATGDGDDPTLAIEGSATSGGGTLTLTGTAPPAPSPERPVRVAVTGRRFEAMNTPEIHLLATPDLELTYDGARLAVTGEVRVPEGSVEIDKPKPGVVAASEDVVFVGGDRVAEAAGGLPLAMRVRVVLGDDVEIDVLGLEAEPRGSLLLIEEPGQPTAGIGEIDLAGGTFQAYGQDLTIERGRLSFGGPIDNPRVDLRAYRKCKDGTVAGLEAEGPLDHPVITLWSEPAMDQTNQLSYLLLGRPIDQASQSEGSLVTNAATSLGLKGGNMLAERLAARFGLEEARIETGDGLEEASLVLGKYLSPRLYVAYGVGLFEAANTLRIRYLLSSKWTLEATTGAATAADLLYTIERGRGAKREPPPKDGDVLEPRRAPAEPTAE